jgi:hypothetical protein
MTLLPSRAGRSVGLFGVLLVALLIGLPRPAHGQLWLQTARVVTPVEQGPLRVMLDSLTSVMERRGVEVRRAPDQDSTMTVTALQNQLIEEEGIGINSANHAFVDYRFSIESGQSFRQRVSHLHFVFRPGPTQADISVLSLNAQAPWMQEFLREKGLTLPTNEAAFIPFQRHLGFAQIARPDETQIVEIGGRTVREGFEEEKEDLIRKVERLTYETFV